MIKLNNEENNQKLTRKNLPHSITIPNVYRDTVYPDQFKEYSKKLLEVIDNIYKYD